jgi:hypothetical protein
MGTRDFRVSDPAIPEPLRVALVHELMNARRAVARAQRAGDDQGVRLARARVQDAKVALGERGPRYWEALDEAAFRTRAGAALKALARSRAPDKTICPSEAARAIGGDRWRTRMPTVQDVARELARQGELELRQKGRRVDPTQEIRGPIRVFVGGRNPASG